ncbi:FadR/GntR family transcriptional regulator [Streptomyces phaeochromogenes]|uniref:FadR/GntR family transcriptional regulator n=1 Tax=Streptomyces phaeochromogenes TaxID=1923 RepID=UPI0036BF61BA
MDAGNAGPGRAGSRAQGQARMSVLLAESIAEGIVSRGLRSGDRLAPEAEMVAEYGIGRATLREALRVLEAQGVIEVRVGAGGGAFVARPDTQQLARVLSLMLRMSDVSVREVFDARLIVEPALAAQAAHHREDRQVERLRENQEELLNAPRGGPEFLRINREFHTLLAEAAQNRPLAALWSALSAIADGHQAGVRYTPAALGGTITSHRKIIEAVESQDADAAARAMGHHLTAAQDYVRRYYRHLVDGPVTLVSGLD